MASADQKNIADELGSKWKGSDTTARIFKSDIGRSKRSKKRKDVRI